MHHLSGLLMYGLHVLELPSILMIAGPAQDGEYIMAPVKGFVKISRMGLGML